MSYRNQKLDRLLCHPVLDKDNIFREYSGYYGSAVWEALVMRTLSAFIR